MTSTVNVVGHFRIPSGLAEHARRLGAVLERQYPIHYRSVAIRLPGSDPIPRGVDEPGDVTIWSMNATELATSFDARLGRKHVGVFFWELEGHRPPLAHKAAERVDEIWAFSSLMERSFSGLGKPVVRVSPFIDSMPRHEPSGSFRVLIVFDAWATLARKNPLGAIEAFRAAFSKRDDVELIVKARHLGAKHTARLVQAMHGLPARLINRDLPLEEHRALIQSASCLLSLHRSEGLGLHLIEAMAMGIPVVATAYGGNADWMNEGNSVPIPWRWKETTRAHGPYPAGSRWAEPDVATAAVRLRKLLDPDHREAIGRAGAEYAREHFSPDKALGTMSERIELLRSC